MANPRFGVDIFMWSVAIVGVQHLGNKVNTILFTMDAILADTEETAIGKAVKAFKTQNPEHLISHTIVTNQNTAIQSIEGVGFVDYEYQTVTEKS